MRRLPLFLLLLLALASCQPDATFEAAEAVFQTGDDRRWAAPRYDDSDWRAERGPTGITKPSNQPERPGVSPLTPRL